MTTEDPETPRGPLPDEAPGSDGTPDTQPDAVDPPPDTAPETPDEAPSPVEYLLHAIAACLTAGIANIASARGVTLTKVTSSVEGDIDLLGILGLSDDVRNGYQGIRVHFALAGDDPGRLRDLVDRSRARSAVFDVLTNGVPVSIDVSTS